MSVNEPENVDTDERFNSLDPVFLERALLRNMTATARTVVKDAAVKAMPVMLGAAMGIKPSESEYQYALIDIYTASAMVIELTKIIDEIAPVEAVDNISEERREEVKNLVAQHPIMKKTRRVLKETIAELKS